MSGVVEQPMMSVKLNLNVRGYLATNAIARQRYVLVLCVACCMLHVCACAYAYACACELHVRVSVRGGECACLARQEHIYG